ncbi:hypothetical protein K469DRAFT_684642 [Zopfia rhizophila CBS 207.26]|uniref:Uncharacterized protein n=1 Tax=Zopfia rhizophila CBS 207.26 TaxID=1314779 RepID=A0A6A6E9I3_9PEZI|nr:hypothetical protein K469DRAFT_684642 [Zopfia rhizophila CBS 207.26]
MELLPKGSPSGPPSLVYILSPSPNIDAPLSQITSRPYSVAWFSAVVTILHDRGDYKDDAQFFVTKYLKPNRRARMFEVCNEDMAEFSRRYQRVSDLMVSEHPKFLDEVDRLCEQYKYMWARTVFPVKNPEPNVVDVEIKRNDECMPNKKTASPSPLDLIMQAEAPKADIWRCRQPSSLPAPEDNGFDFTVSISKSKTSRYSSVNFSSDNNPNLTDD